MLEYYSSVLGARIRSTNSTPPDYHENEICLKTWHTAGTSFLTLVGVPPPWLDSKHFYKVTWRGTAMINPINTRITSIRLLYT